MKTKIFYKRAQLSIFFLLSVIIFTTFVFLNSTSEKLNTQTIKDIPEYFAKQFFSEVNLEKQFKLCSETSIDFSLKKLSYGGIIITENSSFKKNDFRWTKYQGKDLVFLTESFHIEDRSRVYDVSSWPCNNITGRNCNYKIRNSDLYDYSNYVYADFNKYQHNYDPIFSLVPLTKSYTGLFDHGIPWFDRSYFNNSIEEQLEEDISNSMKTCLNLDNFEKYGYSVKEKEEISVNVSVQKNNILFNLNWPIEIVNKESGNSFSMSGVSIIKNIDFSSIYFFVENLINEIIKNPYFDFEKDPKNFLPSNLRYDVQNNFDSENMLIKISDLSSKFESDYYEFYFAIQNRPPILESLDFEKREKYKEIFVIAGNPIIIEPFGYDLDQDEIEYFYYGWKTRYNQYLSDFFKGKGISLGDEIDFDSKNYWITDNEYYETGRFKTDEVHLCKNNLNNEIEQRRCSAIITKTEDIGEHYVVVGIRDLPSQAMDWELVKIIVGESPEAMITIESPLPNNPFSHLSIEDPFILSATDNNNSYETPDVIYRWSENLSNGFYSTTSPKSFFPYEIAPDENVSLLNIKPFPWFNKTGSAKINLIIDKKISGNMLSSEDEKNIEVKTCLPYINERSDGIDLYPVAPYPFNYLYNQENFTDYFYSNISFESSHLCCDDSYNYKNENEICYDFDVIWAGLPFELTENFFYDNLSPYNLKFDGYNSIKPILDNFSSDINFIVNNDQGIRLYDLNNDVNSNHTNDYFRRIFEVQCTGERGNICGGNVTDSWELFVPCQDFGDNEVERCYGAENQEIEKFDYSEPDPDCKYDYFRTTYEFENNMPDKLGNPATGQCNKNSRAFDTYVSRRFYDDSLSGSQKGVYVCNATCDGEGGCNAMSLDTCYNCNQKDNFIANLSNELCIFQSDYYAAPHSESSVAHCVDYLSTRPDLDWGEKIKYVSGQVIINCSEINDKDVFNRTASGVDEDVRHIQIENIGNIDDEGNTCEWVEYGVSNTCEDRVHTPLKDLDSECGYSNPDACCGLLKSANGTAGEFYDCDKEMVTGDSRIVVSFATNSSCVYPNQKQNTCEIKSIVCNSQRSCELLNDSVYEDSSLSNEFKSRWDNYFNNRVADTDSPFTNDYICHANNSGGFNFISNASVTNETNALDGFDNDCDGLIDCEDILDTHNMTCRLGGYPLEKAGVCSYNTSNTGECAKEYCYNKTSNKFHSDPNVCHDGWGCGDLSSLSINDISTKLNGIWYDNECHIDGIFYFNDTSAYFNGTQNLNEFNVTSKDWKAGCEKGQLCIKSIDDFKNSNPANGVCVDDSRCVENISTAKLFQKDIFDSEDLLSSFNPNSFRCINIHHVSSVFNFGFVSYSNSLSDYDCCYNSPIVFKNGHSSLVFDIKSNLYLGSNEDNLKEFLVNEDEVKDRIKTSYCNTYSSDVAEDKILFCMDTSWNLTSPINYKSGFYSRKENNCCYETFSYNETDVSQEFCGCENLGFNCFSYNISKNETDSIFDIKSGICINDTSLNQRICCDSNEFVFDDREVYVGSCGSCNSTNIGSYCYNVEQDFYGKCSGTAKDSNYRCTQDYHYDSGAKSCTSSNQGDHYTKSTIQNTDGFLSESIQEEGICGSEPGIEEVGNIEKRSKLLGIKSGDNLYRFRFSQLLDIFNSYKNLECDYISDAYWNNSDIFGSYNDGSYKSFLMKNKDNDVVCGICEGSILNSSFNSTGGIIDEVEICKKVCGASDGCEGVAPRSFTDDGLKYCPSNCVICEEVMCKDSNQFPCVDENFDSVCGCTQNSTISTNYSCSATKFGSNQGLCIWNSTMSACSNHYLVTEGGLINDDNNKLQTCSNIDLNSYRDLNQRMCYNIHKNRLGFCTDDKECSVFVVNNSNIWESSGENNDICFIIVDGSREEGILFDDVCHTNGVLSIDSNNEIFFNKDSVYTNVCDQNGLVCGDLLNHEGSLNYSSLSENNKFGKCIDGDCYNCEDGWINGYVNGSSSPKDSLCHSVCGSDPICSDSKSTNSFVNPSAKTCTYCNESCQHNEHQILSSCSSQNLSNNFCYDYNNAIYFKFDELNFCNETDFKYTEYKNVYPEDSFIFDDESFMKYGETFLTFSYKLNNYNGTKSEVLSKNIDAYFSSFNLSKLYYVNYTTNSNIDLTSASYSSEKKYFLPFYNKSEEVCYYIDNFPDTYYFDSLSDYDKVNCSNKFIVYNDDFNNISSEFNRKYLSFSAKCCEINDESLIEKYLCTPQGCIFDLSFDNFNELIQDQDKYDENEIISKYTCSNCQGNSESCYPPGTLVDSDGNLKTSGEIKGSDICWYCAENNQDCNNGNYCIDGVCQVNTSSPVAGVNSCSVSGWQ